MITAFPQNTIINEGDPLQLTCEASGQPTPTITWTKNGKQLAARGTLNIPASKRADAGIYVCSANNNVKVTKTATAQVTVQCKFKRYLDFSG